jgi:hypothetical protein
LPEILSYNDSLYLAFHLNVLGQQYSENLLETTQGLYSFLDLVPLAYSSGRELLEDHLVINAHIGHDDPGFAINNEDKCYRFGS